MPIENIQVGDQVEYKNGRRKTINVNDYAIFKQFYDEELNCLTNDEYSIVAIHRPYYETIYSRLVYARKK